MNDEAKCATLSKGPSLTWAMTNQLRQFFSICDSSGENSVDREAFHDLCNGLSISSREADLIFEDLDSDRDGKISFADFSRGFTDFYFHANFGETESDTGPELGDKEEDVRDQIQTTLSTKTDRAGEMNSDEGALKRLLGEMRVSEERQLVPVLETAVEKLLQNLQQLQQEKAQLEETWLREKFEHERHLKRMEEELDSQVKDVEVRMRLKAQAEVEDERKSFQSKIDAEMDNLQAHLVLFEKVNSWLQSHPTDIHDVRLNEVRSKLDEAVNENRQLRMSLLDTQTSVSLVKSELLQLRSLYEEKCKELSSEREKILEVLHEQDHLSQQLNLLHDVNKRLQDTNDSLRSSLEINYRSTKEAYAVPCRQKRGSVLGDYVDMGLNSRGINRFRNESEEESEEGSDHKMAPVQQTQFKDANVLHRRNSNVPRILNQSDSGVSTARDSQEVDDDSGRTTKGKTNCTNENSEFCPTDNTFSSGSGFQPPYSSSPLPVPQENTQSSGIKEYLEENQLFPKVNAEKVTLKTEEFPKKKITDIIKELGMEEKNLVSRNRNISLKYQHRKHGHIDSKKMAPVPLPRMSRKQNGRPAELKARPFLIVNHSLPIGREVCVAGGELSRDENQDLSRHVASLQDDPDEEGVYDTDGEAEKTFKVVFIGDAGVGKSSFALRISKGVFVGQMSSTLGVDFLMRTLRVEGRNYAVQLWDTAGQERFRSITKSYFRKADGVLLLYDCTCEQSFLNVRQWVEDVDNVMTCKRIPLMIVANKIDLRSAAMAAGKFYVTTNEGQKLAKDFDAIFTEASAKNGSNVLHSLANLVRAILMHQEPQKSASVMNLSDEKGKNTNGCCKK